MKIRYTWTEYTDLSEEANRYSQDRARTRAKLTLLCSACFLLGVVFLVAYKVFGLIAPIVMIAGSAALFVYLCTGYETETRQTIQGMRPTQPTAQKTDIREASVEPPLINTAAEVPSLSPLDAASALQNAVETAYKERYVEFRNALRDVLNKRASGGAFMEQFNQLYQDYKLNVCSDTLRALSRSVPQARSRYEASRHDPSSPAISRLDDSVTGFGLLYALLYYAATQSPCSRDEALHHAQRFEMYAQAALKHAAEE